MGQKVIDNALETNRKVTDAGISIVTTALKIGLVAGVAYIAYRSYSKRFIKLKLNPNWPAANISDAQAEAKADAIYKAMYGVGADHQAVASQIAKLNYNAWVKVYNFFGNRQGVTPLSESMNLVQWLNDQFDEEELNELRLLVNGVF